MNIKEVNITDIHPYENNPRHNDEAVQAVAESIREFGFKVPVVIDRDGVIVAGHTRIKAANLLGLNTVPCVIADDLTEEQIKAFRLADNKTAELATWDEEALARELEAITEIDMSLYGFDFPEEEGEIVQDDFEEEPPEEPFTKPGEIYKLGRHRLMIGDSTNPADVKALLDGAEADLVITDPPYNVDYDEKEKMLAENFRVCRRVKENKQTGIDNDKMSDAAFTEFLQRAFANLKASLKPGGAFYIWHAATTAPEFIKGLEAAGLEVRQTLIWVKNNFVIGRQDYHWKHEPCLYGWKEGAAHYFINDRTQDTLIRDDRPNLDKIKREDAIKLLREIFEAQEPCSVIYEKMPHKVDLHPTMKPVELFARLIRNSSRPGEMVLDLFGGSGTAIIAAEQLGRTAYVMEYAPKYADCIIKRFEEFTGEKAERVKEA